MNAVLRHQAHVRKGSYAFNVQLHGSSVPTAGLPVDKADVLHAREDQEKS